MTDHNETTVEAVKAAIRACIEAGDIPAFDPTGLATVYEDVIARAALAAIPEPATVGGVTREQVARAIHDAVGTYDDRVVDAILALFPPAPSTVGTVEAREAFFEAYNMGAQADYEHGTQPTERQLIEAGIDAVLELFDTPATTRDVGMHQRCAFDDTVELARERGMDRRMASNPSLTLDHLLDMQKRIHEGNHSPAKLGRWLGWAQAALVAANVGVTLDDVKRINMLRAASAKGDGK